MSLAMVVWMARDDQPNPEAMRQEAIELVRMERRREIEDSRGSQPSSPPNEAEVERAAKALHNRDQLAHDEWDEADEDHRQWVRGEARAALAAAQSPTESETRFRRAAEWLIRCLDDVTKQVPVRGLDEAWHEYESALAAPQSPTQRRQ